MKEKRYLHAAVCLLTAFALWTAMVCCVDVQPIGPGGTSVGLATLNGLFHRLTSVHWTLYVLTDWLSLLPLAAAAGFGVLGLVQWLRRKSLRLVDRSLLTLGGFYLLLLGAYVFFEYVPVNYRPILIDGVAEVSYPSSTTMLVIGIMSTANFQLRERLPANGLRQSVLWLSRCFTAFMVLGRLLSGVHWLSDIVGGGLLSAGLVMLYAYTCKK